MWLCALRCSVMSTQKISYDTRSIDIDALDPDVRKRYPRFVRRHGRWLIAIEKSYEARTDECVQVLRSDGTIRIVKLQDQVMYQPNNMKRGTKDVFLCKDVTGLKDGGFTGFDCHTLLLDGTGRCESEYCFVANK